MSALLAIDPGSVRSGWVILDADGQVLDHALDPNDAVVESVRLLRGQVSTVVIETIEPWGGFTGPPALETMRWVGRFEEAAWPTPVTLLKRSAILRGLGVGKLPRGQAQAAVRALLVDRYGGGNPAKRGHPLHGITADLWSALGVAVAYADGLRARAA